MNTSSPLNGTERPTSRGGSQPQRSYFGVWLVLAVGAAFAQVRADDPSVETLVGERDLGGATCFASNPLVITEPASWTRYALIAAIACLVGVLATLAVEFVVRRRRHTICGARVSRAERPTDAD